MLRPIIVDVYAKKNRQAKKGRSKKGFKNKKSGILPLGCNLREITIEC